MSMSSATARYDPRIALRLGAGVGRCGETESPGFSGINTCAIVGFSRLIDADENCNFARLRGLRSDLIDPAIAAHRGRIIKRTGDGSLIEFRGVVDGERSARLQQQRSPRRFRHRTLRCLPGFGFRAGPGIAGVKANTQRGCQRDYRKLHAALRRKGPRGGSESWPEKVRRQSLGPTPHAEKSAWTDRDLRGTGGGTLSPGPDVILGLWSSWVDWASRQGAGACYWLTQNVGLVLSMTHEVRI